MEEGRNIDEEGGRGIGREVSKQLSRLGMSIFKVMDIILCSECCCSM